MHVCDVNTISSFKIFIINLFIYLLTFVKDAVLNMEIESYLTDQLQKPYIFLNAYIFLVLRRTDTIYVIWRQKGNSILVNIGCSKLKQHEVWKSRLLELSDA
jgi:hypothetical protein